LFVPQEKGLPGAAALVKNAKCNPCASASELAQPKLRSGV
jgi:hypothetical protein